MIAQRLKRIADFLANEEVPRSDIARLLCSIQQIRLQDVAAKASVGRSHLYQMLSGDRPVSDSARKAFEDFVGIDPWRHGPGGDKQGM